MSWRWNVALLSDWSRYVPFATVGCLQFPLESKALFLVDQSGWGKCKADYA